MDAAVVQARNAQVIAEFREHGGLVGGKFSGAPLVLLQHRGLVSGREYVSPVMYLADPDDPAVIFVFATKAGAPTNPEWFANLTAAGTGEVEVGTERYRVSVTELAGEHRDRIYAEQARLFHGFGYYAQLTQGRRVIPVLALRRLTEK